MQEKDCKSGTEVIIRGAIVAYGLTGYRPVSVKIAHDGVRDFSIESLEPVQLKYDPARKFRKGDLVRITGFHGRLFGMGNSRKLKNNMLGVQVTLRDDEESGGNVELPEGILSDGLNFLSVACIELVKPIEEIEAEAPYFVKRDNNASAFSINRKDRMSSIITVWFGNSRGVTSEEAEKKAQTICDELNREHRESLDA